MRSVVACAIVLLCIVPVVNAQDQPTNGALYTLDKQHSLLDFTARHIGFGRVRGTFKQYRAAAFLMPEDLEQTTFTATIEVPSIDTGTGGRDGILKNEFFDAANHPLILFQSTRLEPDVARGEIQQRLYCYASSLWSTPKTNPPTVPCTP